MRIFRYIVVFILCTFSEAFLSPAQAQVLYEISGKGTRSKSYILATNRYVEMQFIDTIPNVFKCFSRCNKVVTEYRYIDNALRISLGMGLDQLCRMKPSYLTEMFRTELMKQWLGYDDQKSMENFFESVALERNIPIVGLDNIGETMYMLFDREPFHWQCKELLKVPKLGPKAFEQCAGFLRIMDGTEPLDATSVHPESYDAARAILKECGYGAGDILAGKVKGLTARKDIAEKLGIGKYTFADIAAELEKPGRDPREDVLAPVLRSDVLEMSDLIPGMEFKGTVRNIVDFGAFVDIGVHQDGLVHISELADRYVKHPLDVVKVGDIVNVKVLSIDEKRGKIALSMKAAGK